jgi:hypothetical protein
VSASFLRRQSFKVRDQTTHLQPKNFTEDHNNY